MNARASSSASSFLRIPAALFLASLSFACSSGGDGGPSRVQGSAQLPECGGPSAADLDRVRGWINGDLTVTSSSCPDFPQGSIVTTCGVDWLFERTDGNRLRIRSDDDVDEGWQFEFDGRLCGDQLFLSGGFELPLDLGNGCAFEDSSYELFRIEGQGPDNTAVLTVGTDNAGSLTLTGTLELRRGDTGCTADFEFGFSVLSQPSATFEGPTTVTLRPREQSSANAQAPAAPLGVLVVDEAGQELEWVAVDPDLEQVSVGLEPGQNARLAPRP